MVKSNVWLATEWNATYVVIFGQWIILLFRIKWVKMPEAKLSVSAKLIRMLNLAYCMFVLVWLFIWPWRSKTWAAWSKKARISQGHPTTTTVFCKICVRRSKYYLEFSITLRTAQRYWIAVPFMQNFEAYLITEIPFEFLSLTFHISLPRLGYFS